MIRTLLYLVAGLLLGAAIHLVIILTLPQLASKSVYSQLAAMDALDKTVLIPAVKPGGANPLRLDPDLSYALCRLDLSKGPGELTGTLPQNFWSVAVYDDAGAVLYSTTNRDGIGQTLDLGLFDPAETRLLAEQKIDVTAGQLIVETGVDDVFVLVRLAPPQSAVRERYEQQLAKLSCRNIKT